MTTGDGKEAERKGPERSCIGCGTKRPKTALIRLVVGNDGQPMADGLQNAPGRGAYLCGKGCLKAAVKRRAFQRAYRGKATTLEWNDLEEALQRVNNPDS